MITENMSKSKKLHTVNIYDQTYRKIKQIVLEKGGTITDIINDTLLGYVDRDKFLSMYAHNLKEELQTEDAIYVKDKKLEKIAVVRLRVYPVEDLDNSGFYGYCETCDSDSCIHVRITLASGSLMRLKPLDKTPS
jgi:hypothetical protein